MKKNRILFAVLGLVLLAGAAFAQAVLPQVATVNPTRDMIQVVPLGQPSSRSVFASPAEIRAVNQYVKATFVTGSTATGYSNTFGNYQTRLLLDPGITIGYNYVTFAPAPSDGTEQCVFSTATVTSLWLSASAGQTLNDAATTLAANGRVCYLYSASNLTWDRSN